MKKSIKTIFLEKVLIAFISFTIVGGLFCSIVNAGISKDDNSMHISNDSVTESKKPSDKKQQIISLQMKLAKKIVQQCPICLKKSTCPLCNEYDLNNTLEKKNINLLRHLYNHRYDEKHSGIAYKNFFDHLEELHCVSRKENYHCPCCEKKFNAKTLLTLHLSKEHGKNGKEIDSLTKNVKKIEENITEEFRDDCPICNKGKKCPFCKETNLRKDALLNHIYNHKYQQSDIEKNDKYIHIKKIHLTKAGKNYLCPHCDEKLFYKNILLSHASKEHKDIYKNVRQVRKNFSPKKENESENVESDREENESVAEKKTTTIEYNDKNIENDIDLHKIENLFYSNEPEKEQKQEQNDYLDFNVFNNEEKIIDIDSLKNDETFMDNYCKFITDIEIN